MADGGHSSKFSAAKFKYIWLGAWGNLVVNAEMGALRASNLSPGLHPLLPDLPDLPSTILENQKFHSLWRCAWLPCLVALAFPGLCLWAALGLVARFVLLGPPWQEHPSLTSSHSGNVVYQTSWKRHCTSFGDSLDS